MKIKKELLDHLFDNDFKEKDFLEFEERDAENICNFLNTRSSVLVETTDVNTLLVLLDNLYYSPRHCRTKFAIKQYQSILHQKFSEISPALAYLYQELRPAREMHLSNKDLILRKLRNISSDIFV